MATFTISLSGSTVVNGSKSWTVSDADVQALIDVMAVKFAPRGGPNASPTPLGPQQALLAWVQNFVATTIIEVRKKKLLDAQAAIQVSPIVFT